MYKQQGMNWFLYIFERNHVLNFYIKLVSREVCTSASHNIIMTSSTFSVELKHAWMQERQHLVYLYLCIL